jgi:hypothetical protein
MTATRKTAEPSPREDYERIAAAFCTLVEIDMDRLDGRLDISTFFAEPGDHVLRDAMDTHLRAVFGEIDFYTEAGSQLYVQARLVLDAQRTEAPAQQGSEASRSRSPKN